LATGIGHGSNKCQPYIDRSRGNLEWSKKKRHSPPLIALSDFERIFRTIQGFLISEEGDPSKACNFFGIIGAGILNKHHGLQARPVFGTAIYKIGPSHDDVLAIGDREDGVITSTHKAFHCWVEADGWMLDFQAPLFREMVASKGGSVACERKMFQKRLEFMKPSLDDLTSPGDFGCLPSPELKVELLEGFLANVGYMDIAKICVEWYRPRPKKMMDPLEVADQNGKVKPVRLSELRLVGSW